MLVAVVPWRWDAWKRRRIGRTATTVAAVCAVFISAGLIANHLGSFYPTLGSLLGTSSDPGEGANFEAGDNGAYLGNAFDTQKKLAAQGKGTTVHVQLTGQRTGITRDVDVYLPAAYTDPKYAGKKFPVVEWFHGFPGEPREVVALFKVPELFDTAIANGTLPPTVVIIPDINGEPRLTHDEESVDAVHGKATDTFLSADVRSWAVKTFRVRKDRAGWALAGWSSGGYTALNFLFRHPQWYSIAISQSGYDQTITDVTTGDLFQGRNDVKTANDVSANMRAHPVAAHLLITAGKQEHDEQEAMTRMRNAVTAPTLADFYSFDGGGHNQDAVKAQLPFIVSWLGQYLPGPSAQLAGEDTKGGVAPWKLPDTGGKGALVGTES
jgi:enterochelin esterase-like enzyme